MLLCWLLLVVPAATALLRTVPHGVSSSPWRLGYTAVDTREVAQVSPTLAVDRLFQPTVAGNFSPSSVAAKRLSLGIDRLQEARRPSGRDEAWRYTNMRTLFEPDYSQLQAPAAVTVTAADIEAFIEPACRDSYVVIVDGTFRPDLCRVTPAQPIMLLKAGDIGAEHPLHARLIEDLARDITDGADKARDSYGSAALVSLGMARSADELVVSVRKGSGAALQIIQCASASCTHSRVTLVVEEGAALQLAQSVVSLSHNPRPSLMNSHTRLMLGPGARLDHLYMQELSHESRLLEVVSADVPGSAHYALTALQMGARVGRVNAHINLNAPNANCTLNGVFLAHAQQSLDLHSSIDHRAAATTSRQYQRNVVGDRGEAVFKGRIRIPEVAVKADSEQLCRTLMLGERARVVAMPTLEITADDITCSHGAAICDLDENAMFYLSSRGINRNEARKLLLRSFVLELLQGSLLGPAALERVIKKLESMNPETDGVDSLRKFESM